MYTNDSQVIDAVLQGDKSSYEVLVNKYKKMVYGIAWSHLGDSDLSEDAAQEAFIKAYCYLRTLREPDKFQGWLARIARNVCNTLGRRSKRDNAFKQRWAVLESAETEPHQEESAPLTAQLWESFADLPATHREALTLFYIEGKSVAETAAALGVTEQALRTRLHRARTALRVQLERKLEDSLTDLQPSSNFTRSVLVLLPLSPKGAVGVGGGVLAIFGKLFAGLSFALWMAAASTLPLWGFYSLLGRVEESSLADVPQNQPARSIIRRGYQKVVLAMFAGFAVAWLLMRFAGQITAMQIEAVVYGCMTLLLVFGAIPQLCRRVNSPGRILGVLTWAVFSAAIAAIAFFGAPAATFAVAIFVMSVVLYFIGTPEMPQRVGHNLFLRGALGLGDTPEVEWPLPRSLTRLELRTFARLLADLALVRDYRFRDGAIILSLYGMRKAPLAVFGIVPGGSEVTITPDGACTATICEADLQAVRRISPNADSAQLQEQACQAIRYALNCFAAGDVQAAIDALSVKIDRAALQSPSSARNNRLRKLVTLWFGIVVLVQFTSHSAVVAIIATIVGFAVPMVAMAITLRINKRESRSL